MALRSDLSQSVAREGVAAKCAMAVAVMEQ
jgi:hypothetical protein